MNSFLDFIQKTKPSDFAKYIDNTLLKPNADYKTLEKYIDDTRKYGFKTLVLPPSLLEIAREISGNTIDYTTVIGFPLGSALTSVKIYEVLQVVDYGVSEIDMVMNINYFKMNKYDQVLRDIVEVTSVAKKHGINIVKVIIETTLLSDDEKIKATEIVIKSGADYVKTCTGFLGGGATIHDVLLINSFSKGRVKIKASGGIRHALDTVALILAGASRIGTSSGSEIMEEYLKIRESLS